MTHFWTETHGHSTKQLSTNDLVYKSLKLNLSKGVVAIAPEEAFLSVR